MKILDVEISLEIPGDYFIWLRSQHRGGAALAFQKVEEPQATPGRVHIDTTVEDIQVACRQKRTVDLKHFVPRYFTDEFRKSTLVHRHHLEGQHSRLHFAWLTRW